MTRALLWQPDSIVDIFGAGDGVQPSRVLVLICREFIASCFSWGVITDPQLKRPIERALIDAPLSALASVNRTPPDVMIGRLRAHGIVATGDQSVHQLSGTSGVGENRLLAIVFLSE